MTRSLTVKGKENVPKGEPFVLTCTHTTFLDILMLGTALYPQPIYFMAKKELFEGKAKNIFFRSLKAFPVNRENPGPSAVKIPLKLLKEGKSVGIFPTGTRSTEDISMKKGAVSIALKSKSPLVPAVYNGPVRLSDFLKGQKAEIIINPPIYVKDGNGLNRTEATDKYMMELEMVMKGNTEHPLPEVKEGS